jgi:hypothetical protein
MGRTMVASWSLLAALLVAVTGQVPLSVAEVARWRTAMDGDGPLPILADAYFIIRERAIATHIIPGMTLDQADCLLRRVPDHLSDGDFLRPGAGRTLMVHCRAVEISCRSEQIRGADGKRRWRWVVVKARGRFPANFAALLVPVPLRDR